MDGDASAKTMDKGASATLPNTDFGDSIFEASKPRVEPVGDKATGAGTVCCFTLTPHLHTHFSFVIFPWCSIIFGH